MHEVSLACPQEQVDPVSEALEALDALSISVEDADAHTDAEQALFGEPGMPAPRNAWQRSRVVALFADGAVAQGALDILQAQDFFAGCEVLGSSALAEQDWVRLTQSQFVPVSITPEFWIVPTWHEPPAEARVVIRLDPGLAFGTGTHPTTRMCLRWVSSHVKPSAGGGSSKRVLDYGCGSGILAIGAAKFGATEIDAVDIDPAAVESTRYNADANGVALRSGFPENAQGYYNVVLANILATPLRVLAPLLCAHVAPGGSLVLAGILERQVQELKDTYAPWLNLTVSDCEDGWVLMTAAS